MNKWFQSLQAALAEAVYCYNPLCIGQLAFFCNLAYQPGLILPQPAPTQ